MLAQCSFCYCLDRHPVMPFFAAAEGIVAPDPGQIKAVYEDEDSPKEPAREEWWKCLALLDSDTGKAS